MVYETFHLSDLPNYTTKGTIHIVVNNQVQKCWLLVCGAVLITTFLLVGLFGIPIYRKYRY
jgi:hypothetical protein